MFVSKEEAYFKPPRFKSNSCILGIGNGFLLILLLTSLKSEMNPTVSFFFGVINVGAAHSELFLRFKTPTNVYLTSVLRVSSYTYGIGNGSAWYG